jgi:Flp pilus assembly protein TadD
VSRLANQLLATGKTTDALALATRLSDESPKSAAAAALLARAHAASGHRVEAAREYERAIALSETPRGVPMYRAAIRELSAPESKAAK